MPQLVYTDPTFQVAASNLGRLFSPQVAAQGQLMQARRGQIDSATERNRALTASELAEEQRRAEMHDARSGLVNALLDPVSQNLAKTMPAGDLYRLFDQNIDAEAIQGIRTPGIDEETARLNAIILSRGNLPSYTDAATQDGVQNIFNNRRDESVAVAKQQGDNTIAAEIAKRMYEQQNPAIQEPVRLGEGDRLVNPLTGEIIVSPVSPEPPDPFTLSPGGVRYNPDGTILASNPAPVAGGKPIDAMRTANEEFDLTGNIQTLIDESLNGGSLPAGSEQKVILRAVQQAKNGSSLAQAVSDAINSVVQEDGLIALPHGGHRSGWGAIADVFQKNNPSIPHYVEPDSSPTPGAPPPATAPTSQSTSQSGAAPGAGDSPQAPLPVPMAGGKVDAASMVRGKYYKGADGSIIYLKPDGSIVQF